MTINDAPGISFAALATAVAVAAWWQDVRTSKIRNRLIIAGLACGAALNVVFILYFRLFTKNTVDAAYLGNVLLNALLALVFGFVMWKSRVWSAADGKLFFALAFLLPLEYYSGSYVSYFPAFTLAINIFTFSICVVVLKILINMASELGSWRPGLDLKKINARERLRSAVAAVRGQWLVFVVMFVIFNAMFLAIGYVRPLIRGAGPSVLFNIGFLIFMFAAVAPISNVIRKLFEKYPAAKKAALLIVAAALFFALRDRHTGAAVAGNAKMMVYFMVFIGLARKLFEVYLKKADLYFVRAADARPGMVPSEEAHGKLSAAGLDAVFMDGLSVEQAEAVRKAFPPEQELEFTRTIPFAPLALGGLLLTIIFRQSAIHLAMSLMK